MKTSDKFREIFENSPIGIIFHDKKGIIINANKSALEIMGVPKFEDIKGINLFDNPSIGANKEKILKKGIVRFQAPLDFDNIKEFGLYHPTKSGVVFLDYTVTITESGYLIQIQDITKRKYAEEALEESEEKFAKAFHSNSAAMTITRLNDGMIIDANESFKRLFGYTLDETVGHSTNELGIWLNSQERDDEVDQLLKQGNLPMHEVTFGTKSGEHINVMFSVELISISGQHFILSTIMDVTERKKAEEKLKESKILSDALNKINTNINSKLDYNEIMQSIVEEGAKAIGAESSVINIKERSNWIVKYVYNFPNSILGQIKSNEESPTSLYVANKKETVAFNDAQNDSRVNKNGMRLHGVASLLVAPIILRDEIKGIIAFYHHQKPFQFTEAHIDFANKLASSLSQALENAQLIDELQNAAEELEVSNEELRTTTEQLYASNDELQDTAKKLQKVNKELKESEKRYRSIIENVQDAYFRADKDGKIIIASPSAARMYGYSSPQEIIGASALSMYKNKEDRDSVIEDLNKYGKFYDNEVLAIRKDNTSFWVSQNAQFYYDEEGQIRGTETFVRDITERKNREKALRESEKKFQVLIQNLQLGVALVDEEGKFNVVNPSFLRLFGLDSKLDILNVNSQEWGQWEVYGEIGELLHVDEHPVRKAAITGEPVRNQLISVKNPGAKELNWMLVSAEPILNKNGNINMIICTYYDITERKKAEEKLKLAYDNLEKQVKERTAELELASIYNRSLIEASLDPLVTIGLDGKITDVNNATELVTGYSKDELIGTDFSNYFTEPKKAKLGYQKVFREGEVRDYPLQIKHLNGHITPVLYHASVYRDESGEVMGVFAAARDITEIQYAENKLKETINELEQSNKELQSFAYITSHDLQEPLRSIASYAQLLERRYKGQLDDNADDFLDFMVSGATRMKEQIQGLLDYSRVGTQGKEFKEFNASNALNAALSNLRSSIEKNDAEINPDPLPNIVGDEGQITRVFQNLIINALKFKKEGVKPKIHISAQKIDSKYIFSVSDNGIGIEEQYNDKIFEVFKRLHAIGEYEGAGIGLAIVKRIIDRHNGKIWIESELGKGSTFYFTIPVK